MSQQDTIVKDFLEQFPELKNHPSIEGDDYSDTPYSFFSVSRDILINSLETNPDLAEKISAWLNGILNNIETSDYLEEMLWIEFFEGSELDEPYRTFLLSQLRDFASYAQSNSYKFALTVDQRTQLSKTLQQLGKQLEVIRKNLNNTKK